MADDYFNTIITLDTRLKDIRSKLIAGYQQFDIRLESIKEDNNTFHKASKAISKQLEEKFKTLSMQEQSLNTKAKTIEYEMLKKLNKPFHSEYVLNEAKKKYEKFKTKSIAVKRTPDVKMFDGNEMVRKFSKHFAQILIKNFRTFKFRNNWKRFSNKIKGVGKLLNLFSFHLIRKFSLVIKAKITFIQKIVKGYLMKKKYLNHLQMAKNIILFKQKVILFELICQISKRRKKKMNTAERFLSNLTKRKNKIKQNLKQKYKHESNILLAVKYNDSLIKLKGLIGLVNNIKI